MYKSWQSSALTKFASQHKAKHVILLPCSRNGSVLITAAGQSTGRMFVSGGFLLRHLTGCVSLPQFYFVCYHAHVARCHTDVKEAHWSFKGFHSFHIHALVDNEYAAPTYMIMRALFVACLVSCATRCPPCFALLLCVSSVFAALFSWMRMWAGLARPGTLLYGNPDHFMSISMKELSGSRSFTLLWETAATPSRAQL